MKKLLNLVGSFALLVGSATSAVACSSTSNVKPNPPVPADKMQKAIKTELQKFSTSSNYLTVDYSNESQSWGGAVKDAVYQDLSANINGFKDQIKEGSLIVSNSNYQDINYDTLVPTTAKIQVDGVTLSIYVNTKLANEIITLKNNPSTSSNPYYSSVDALKMSDLVTSGFYTEVGTKGQEWLSSTPISQFFNDVLNPFNPNSKAALIPTVVPTRGMQQQVH